MAVQSDTSSISYTGNNSTSTSYSVPFVFQENSHLAAIAKVTATGVETAVTLTNHTGAGDPNGGTVRTAVAVPATSTLTIFRTVPATQTTTYQEGGDFPAASHERALDKLTFIAQQNQRSTSRSIKVTEADGARTDMVAVANSLVGLDANKQPKAMTVSEVKSLLAISGTTLSVPAGMKTFADAGERALAVPEFTGQLGTQRDTGVVYVSTGTSAGNWSVVNISDLSIVNDDIANDTITNAKIKSDAAIAGTKIAPDFGSQNVVTTGGAVVGHTQSVFGGKMEVFAGGSGAFVSVMRHTNDAIGPALAMIKTRGTTADSKTIVQSGDSLGSILWQGTDGSSNLGGASIVASVDGTPSANDMPSRLVFGTTANGAPSVTERMRITSGGTVLVGKTASGFGIEGCEMFGSGAIYATRDGDLCLTLNRLNSNGTVVSIRRSDAAVGSISVTTTATAYNTSSDYRLKENPSPLIGGLATIDQLQPCEFTWKSEGSIGRGFIAHELQAVVPEAVTGEKDAVDADGNPEYQGVDAAKLVPYLVSAIKELKTRVEQLEAQLQP